MTALEPRDQFDRQSEITPALLRHLIRFDEQSGKYFWRRRAPALFHCKQDCNRWNSRYPNTELFKSTSNRGYSQVTIFGLTFKSHRVIWAFHYGEWPNGCIDHINGNRSDNRLSNLRECSALENQRNKAMPPENKSGRVGVYWFEPSKKWRCGISVQKRSINLGTFETFDEAAAARSAAEAKYGFHPNHGKRRL